MDLKTKAESYFRLFSAKDLPGLEGMFDQNVTLRDWEISAEGREAVLKANAGIFEAVNKLQVKPLTMYQDGNTVACEIEIDVDADTIKVLDVIEFTEAGKISAIRAYKG